MQSIVFKERVGIQPTHILRIAAAVFYCKPSFRADHAADHIIFTPVLGVNINGNIELHPPQIGNELHRTRFRGIQKIVMVNFVDAWIGLIHFARS